MGRHQLILLPLVILVLLHLSSCEKKNVTIPVLAPLYLFTSDRYSYNVAMKYAFDLINQRSDILKDYNLIPEFYDTVGVISKSVYVANEIVHVDKCNNRKVPPAIVGPAFSNTAIATAEAIALYYILQYTYGATSPLLDNHYQYPFLVRTLPGTSVFSKGHVALMKRFRWKRAGIIYDHHTHDGIFNKIAEDLIAKLRASNVTVVGAESVDAGAGNLATPDDEIRERLERLKAADVKILFAQFSWIGAYRVFCQAFRLGMFGKNFVWIVHPRVESVERWLDVPNNVPKLRNQINKCTEQQYKLISDRMLYFQQQALREDDNKTISNLTAAEYKEYVKKNRIKEQNPSFYTSFSHGYAFDTVWSMALTLDKAIPELAKMNSSLDNMLIKNIEQAKLLRKIAHDVVFEGITGTVKLNRAQGRIGTLTLYQIKNKNWSEVGSFYGTTGELKFHANAEENLWIDGRVPSDKSRERNVLQNVPLGLYLPISIVAGLGIVLSIGVLFFNIYNRNERYIRKSAPLFNNLIILGIMMCLSTVVFFGFPVNQDDTNTFLTMCRLRSWMLCLGFSLSFGSMFVKTWRVYKIFTNRKLKYSIERLSNLSLIGMVVGTVSIDMVILVLWHLIDPIEVKINSLPKKPDPDDPGAVILPILYTCYSENQAKWITTIYVLKGILLLYGLFLAYETRNVQFEHLNDSRMIGVCVYNVAVMSILGGLLRIILKESFFKESFGITAICIIFPSLGTLVLIFLPKGKRLILGIDTTPNGYSRVVRFVKRDTHVTETETSDGVVIEGPAAKNDNHFHLRKDSVCSEGVTSVTSSIPCSNSRIMPIYEEATASSQESSFGGDSPA